MKKKLLLILVLIFAGASLTASRRGHRRGHHGGGFGSSFAGGFAGGVTAGALTSKGGSSRGEVEAARAQERINAMQREQDLRLMRRGRGPSRMMYLMFIMFFLLIIFGLFGLTMVRRRK